MNSNETDKILDEEELTKILMKFFSDGWECVSGDMVAKEIHKNHYTHYMICSSPWKVAIPNDMSTTRNFWFLIKCNLNNNLFEFNYSSTSRKGTRTKRIYLR